MPEVLFSHPFLLACWLANGLLSGLADRLAASQRLRLPYLDMQGGGDGGGKVL